MSTHAGVGTGVGLAVGDSVGLAVGAAVGLAVGDDVGATVGDAVGDVVGDAVGLDVGEAVGAAVGQWSESRPLLPRNMPRVCAPGLSAQHSTCSKDDAYSNMLRMSSTCETSHELMSCGQLLL